MGYKDWRPMMRGKFQFIVIAALVLLSIFSLLNEVLDLSHLIFGVSSTPINWTEIAIELTIIFFIGLALIYILSVVESKRLSAEQARKRAEEELRKYREHLEELVEEHTAELQREITERKEMQEKLLRQEKLAVLGNLAGGVGHELRNPIGAIKNAAYFLNMALEEPEPEVKETLDILEREVATSERIISSLLDFARPETPTRRKVDINKVVKEALSLASVPEKVEVVSRLDEALPTILGDPDQLGQVFSNIILNAVQSMREGGRIVIKSEAPSPEWVTISFTDTGTGIPQENMEKLFEPLFTTRAKGIGLGLALTKTLVEGHGGTIEAASEVGKGSTFTVRLPMSGR